MYLQIPAEKTGSSLRFIAACAIVLALTACMSVSLRPTAYTPVNAAQAKQLQLAKSVSAPLTNDATVTLAAGSQWILAGSVPEGQVYRKAGGTLMIDAKRLREAYLVIADGKLVGFYFPGESAFTPVAYAPTLNLE
ncbi:Lipoprotein [Bordetella sputigena]|uniref:hypothetical protein n=1 Tax=Bordetella sputigena TaxID=1416810 RepID=UPI0039EFB3CC